MHTQRMMLRRVAVVLQGNRGRRTKFELKYVPDGNHFKDMGCPVGGEEICQRDHKKLAGGSAWRAIAYASLRLGARVGGMALALFVLGWSAHKVLHFLSSLLVNQNLARA